MSVTDYDYESTRNEIIQDAFEVCQVVEAGQSLSGNQLQQGLRKFQRIVKSWVTKGIHLWNMGLVTFSTTASNASYTTTVDQSIIGIDKAWIVSGTEDLPLEVVSYSKYLDIVNRTGSSGRPTIVAYRRTPSSTTTAHEVCFYPTPDAIYSIKLWGVYPINDQDSSGETTGLPAEYQRALACALAVDLLMSYPDSVSRMQLIKQEAVTAFQEAFNFSSSETETTCEIESFFRIERA